MTLLLSAGDKFATLMIVSAIVVVVGFLWYQMHLADERKKAAVFAWRQQEAARAAAHRQQLWDRYQACLANMTSDPAARAQVVNAGRAWYGYLRGGDVSLYDEMAITNDVKQAGG